MQKKKLQPKVSVIIPCYNLGEYLNDAVDSVLDQTFSDFEIIIIDDGSNDLTTAETVKSQTDKDSRISTYRTQNRGLSNTRNFGIKKAKGKYIMTLDADDKISPFYLEKAVKILDQGEYDIVSPWIKCFGMEDTEIKHEDGKLETLLAKNIVTSSSLYKKQVWEKVGGYDPGFTRFGDWDFWIRASIKGYKWTNLKEFLFFYRMRPNSNSARENQNTEFILAQHQKLYRKHQTTYAKYFAEVLLNKDAEFYWTWQQLKNYHQLRQENDKLRLDLSYTTKELETAQYKLDYNSMVLIRINRLLDMLKYGLKKLILPTLLFRFVKKIKSRLDANNKNNQLFARIAKTELIPENDPLVSVVIPCFNYGKYLPEALESILNQSWKRIEVIILDDGSTDTETKKVLEKIQTTNYPIPVKVIRQSNQGVVAARNNAISKARGKYIVALDADDKLDSSYIEKCVWILETNPQTGLAYSNLKKFERSSEIYKFGDFDLRKMKDWNQVPTTACFRKVCWEETGGYKEVMKKGHEDWEFWLSIAEKGWEGKRIDEELMYYRVHSKDSLSQEALRINSNLVSRIKELHPDSVETIENRFPRQFPKPEIDFGLFNRDSKSKDKVILLLSQILLGGGAERLWTNYSTTFIKHGYKFLIITFEDARQTVYEELQKNSIGIFNLPAFLPKELWLRFIESQYQKYDIKATIISNAKYAYDHLAEIKAYATGMMIDAIYNDSKHGLSDVSVANDNLIDLHLINNPRIRDIYQKAGIDDEKVFYLASPIDLEYFSNNYNREKLRLSYHINPNDFVITYIGRLSEEKNIDKLINSVSDLIIEVPSLSSRIKLLIVGEGGIQQQLEKLVDELKLRNNVIFFPFQNDPREVYALADLFALVSSIDGFPLSIQEALAMDLPVLATDVGAKKEVLKHGVNSYLLNQPDRFEITKALKSIINENFFKQQTKYRETILPYDRNLLGEDLLKKLNLK